MKMEKERLKIIKRDNSTSMCFEDITCELVCKPSEFCNLITNTYGVKECLIDLAEHSVGLWSRVNLQVLKGIDSASREFRFTFGTRVNGEAFSILILYLDCRCKRVRLCGMPEIVYIFLHWANGKTKFVSLLDEYRKAVLR